VLRALGRDNEVGGVLIERVQRLSLLAQPLDMDAQIDEGHAVLNDRAAPVVNGVDAYGDQNRLLFPAPAFDFDGLGVLRAELRLDPGNRLRVRHPRHEEAERLSDHFRGGEAGQGEEAVVREDDRIAGFGRIGEDHRHARDLGGDHERTQRAPEPVDFLLCEFLFGGLSHAAAVRLDHSLIQSPTR
jgi:hypothetical protein